VGGCANAQQAKQIYRYKNIKEKLYKTNAVIWQNNVYRAHPSARLLT